MFSVVRTDSANTDFQMLVNMLNNYLSGVNGENDTFYSQYNHIDLLKHVILLYKDEVPVGCGAVKEYEPGVMEIKRMFTHPAHRGIGVASTVLSALEEWSAEMGYQKCILETGRFMPDAVALYTKRGYHMIPNYGPYVQASESICFEKMLK